MSLTEQELIDSIMQRTLSLWDLAEYDLSGLDLGFMGKYGINLIRACLLVKDPHNEQLAINYLFEKGAPISDSDLQFARNVFPGTEAERALISLIKRKELMQQTLSATS